MRSQLASGSPGSLESDCKQNWKTMSDRLEAGRMGKLEKEKASVNHEYYWGVMGAGEAMLRA